MPCRGGAIDGAAVRLDLIDERGWRIDRLGELDIRVRDTFVAAFTADLVEIDALAGSHRRCIRHFIAERVPERDLERTFSEGDVDYAYDSMREVSATATTRRRSPR